MYLYSNNEQNSSADVFILNGRRNIYVYLHAAEYESRDKTFKYIDFLFLQYISVQSRHPFE